MNYNERYSARDEFYQEEQEQEDDIPFFADATLDLEEAQGIALTPDASHAHKLLTLSNPEFKRLEQSVPLPQLNQNNADTYRLAEDDDDDDYMNNVAVVPDENNITRSSTSSSSSRSNRNGVAAAARDGKRSSSRNRSRSNSNTNASAAKNTTAAAATTVVDEEEEHILQNESRIHESLPSDHPHHPRNTATSFSFDLEHPQLQHHLPMRPPRRPRDTQWIAWFLFVALPLLIVPIFVGDAVWKQDSTMIQQHDIQKVDVPIIITAVVAILFARIFYLSRGGGEGDDRRYFCSQILIVTNMAACFILPVVTLLFYNLPVRGTFLYNSFVLALAFMTMKDIYTSAKLFRSTRIMREGVNDGQRTLFRMLVSASLDVLSRSMKCQSFYRVVVFVILLQLGVILLIQRAIASVMYLEGIVQQMALLVLGVVGYWVTGICMKLLSYLAYGGITAWFVQQSALVHEMERMKQRRNEQNLTNELNEQRNGDNSMLSRDQDNMYANVMPEAYRNTDASAYSLGIEFDEGIDDDYDDEMFSLNVHRHENSNNGDWMSTHNSTLTIRAFLKSALTVSFGSIVQCALLGGVANFVWSLLRMWESFTASQLRYESLGQETFQEMDIERHRDDGLNLRQSLFTSWQKFIVASKSFVTNHNDLALAHVGAYYKSYTRAANDVMSLIITSGELIHVILLEPSNLTT
jgi:hypothetical protein